MPESEIELTLIPPAVIRVLMPGGPVEEMKLETYIAGAVAAEIGEKMPLEALKAQAVAARTYVVAAQRHREQNADVCTTAHCQKWKRVDPISSPEVFRALSETWGLVAVYDGKLIQTFFFEHCDGHTRNAEEMLIPSTDYLRGVDCSCGHLTLKGHGVGMCERGAIVMARRGATFAQILRHYYRGVSIGRMLAESQVAPDPEEIVPPRAPESKKPRVRKIGHETFNEARKHSKVQRPPIRPVPTTPPELKAAPPKRPILKRVLVEKIPPEDKPESIKPASPPILKRLQLGLLRTRPDESSPSRDESKRDDFVVVARAVAPVEPKSVEPTPNNNDESKDSADAEDIVIHIPRNISVQTEPMPAIKEESVSLAPSLISDEIAEPQVSPMQVEPDKIEEQPLVEPVQATTQTLEPVAVEPKLEIKSAAVPETALPPLEGIEIKPTRRLHVDHLPGARMIAGNLARTGIVVVVENSRGNQTLVFSGTASHYGEGGFETLVEEDGLYRVLIEGQTIEVKLQSETAFIHAG